MLWASEQRKANVVLRGARVLDPAEGAAQFPGIARFLTHKWYFDELYSALIVRPALVVSDWCKNIDTRCIDWLIDNSAAVARRRNII